MVIIIIFVIVGAILYVRSKTHFTPDAFENPAYDTSFVDDSQLPTEFVEASPAIVSQGYMDIKPNDNDDFVEDI